MIRYIGTVGTYITLEWTYGGYLLTLHDFLVLSFDAVAKFLLGHLIELGYNFLRIKYVFQATPYSCPICGFKSGRKDNLKQHIEKRHCSANTTIKQLEDMYPDMYKVCT